MTTAGIADLQLLEIQVDALFTHDPDTRIRSINDPDGDPAPRFFFGRTRQGNLWRFSHDLPENTVRRLEDLTVDEPVNGELQAEPRYLRAYMEVLREDREVLSVDSGPAYRFPNDLPAPADVTRITRSNLHLLAGMVSDADTLALTFEAREPRMAVMENGVAVSLCYSSRLTARAAEAGVETLEGYRGRGYASKVIIAWAHAIRATGRIPLYSTSWDNLASRAVARKLELVQYATDLSLW